MARNSLTSYFKPNMPLVLPIANYKNNYEKLSQQSREIPLNECISKSFVYIIKFEPLFEFQIFVDKSFRK